MGSMWERGANVCGRRLPQANITAPKGKDVVMTARKSGSLVIAAKLVSARTAGVRSPVAVAAETLREDRSKTRRRDAGIFWPDWPRL